MNIYNFADLGADVLLNFSVIPQLLLETNILGVPLWSFVLGTGIGLYLSWVVIKFSFGID